jgi:hypothetical protein
VVSPLLRRASAPRTRWRLQTGQHRYALEIPPNIGSLNLEAPLIKSGARVGVRWTGVGRGLRPALAPPSQEDQTDRRDLHEIPPIGDPRQNDLVVDYPFFEAIEEPSLFVR